MDVWVNFTHATRFQAEGIFKCFFPSKPSPNSAPPSPASDASQQNLPLPKRKMPSHAVPLLDEAEISELAKRFADAIPEDELSVASLQGYLLKNKTRPRECVEDVDEWIIQERETREKLKKEKAEREAKEKKEAAELERKEKEEKEAKEKEEKEAKEKLERREMRAKARKNLRTEPTLRSETSTAISAEDSQVLSKDLSSSSESASSSGSDSSNAGIEADTEESVTSEDESDHSGKTSADDIESGGKGGAGKAEKWVAVKGQQTTEA
jgi:chaperone BCS1